MVPLVRDAIRGVDVAARRIDVDLAFLGDSGGRDAGDGPAPAPIGKDEGVQIDVVTLFPQWFELVHPPSATSPTRSRPAASCGCSTRASTRRSAAARSTTRRSAAAPGWCCASTSWTTRCAAFYNADPVELRGQRRVIALTPGGRMLDETLVDELAAEPAMTLLCGRYEGFDERIVQHFCSDAVSIGRYVLAGGELAAMVLCDAVLRKLPGRARARGLGRGGVLQRGARRRSRVPALHAARRVPGLGGARGAALRAPRGDPPLAPGPQPRARCGIGVLSAPLSSPARADGRSPGAQEAPVAGPGPTPAPLSTP